MSLVYYRILFLHLLVHGATIAVYYEPQFLFSGQSNMIGHSSDSYSIEKDNSLQRDIFNLLGDGMQEKISLRLQEAFINGRIQNDNKTVANHEAKLVTELYNRGILGNITEPHELAKCIFEDPSHKSCSGRQTPSPLSPSASCGCSFGHELVFSHTLSQTIFKNTTFTVRKIAVGGSEIYKDWYPGIGKYWDSLNSTIHDNPGDWRGFAWHQGENDVFSNRQGQDTTLFYLGNLTQFIAAVRTEIASVNPTRFLTPSDVPIAIFELGFWPQQGQYRERVVKAQQTFVANDANSVLIKLDDLSHSYHLEPVSLMIAGFRLARALTPLLDPLYNHTILDSLEITNDEKISNGNMSKEAAADAVLSSSKLSKDNDRDG